MVATGIPVSMNEARSDRARLCALLVLIIIAIGGTTVLWAQGQTLPATALAAAETEPGVVRLLVGRSTVLDVGAPIARVSLTSADVADAMVTSPNQLLLNGKLPGTISLFVWPRGGSLKRYEVTVLRDLAGLQEQMKVLFPKEKIDVQSNGKSVVLSGAVTSKDMIEKAVNVAAGYVDKREEVVTLLQLRPDAPSNQVLLRVRFAEVNRSALTELGTSFFSNGYKDAIGRVGTEQFGTSLPNFEEDKIVFSDFLNLFLFDTKHQLGAVIKALQSKGMFQSLAEPNLVAESGKEASFLAGGEIPIPVAQGSGANMAVSVTFKEFGIRLNFTPVVNGDRIHLKVRPEVSTLDFGNAVVLNGFRIPALQTRRTETELELQNHQTFAIAGLMNNSVANTMQKIPGIGDIPILGLLFRSKQAQKNQTELVVMITPEILPNNSVGVTSELPRTPETYMSPVPARKTSESPAPAFTPARPTSVSEPPKVSSKTSATPLAASLPVVATPPPAIASSKVSALIPSVPVAQATPIPTAEPAAAPKADAIAKVATPKKSDAEKQAEKAAREDAKRQEKARAEEAKRQAKVQAEEAKRVAAKAEADRKAAAKEKEQLEKAAREKLKDQSDTTQQADEDARLQAEVDRQQPKSDVTMKLQAAEAALQAELAKNGR